MPNDTTFWLYGVFALISEVSKRFTLRTASCAVDNDFHCVVNGHVKRDDVPVFGRCDRCESHCLYFENISLCIVSVPRSFHGLVHGFCASFIRFIHRLSGDSWSFSDS